MHTIAAIATPHAAGGIAVIRISGDTAISVAQQCFRSTGGKSLAEMSGYSAISAPASHTMCADW